MLWAPKIFDLWAHSTPKYFNQFSSLDNEGIYSYKEKGSSELNGSFVFPNPISGRGGVAL